jgi:cobalt-zinc-cadmium efflux system protein
MENHHRPSRLALAFFLNLGFSVLELIGGLWTNSMAILSDSVHDLGDSVSIGISWFMDRKARKKPTREFTYGYARFSLLGALISSLILLVGSTVVIIEAIQRLLSPEPIDAVSMIYFAVAGILVNGWAAWSASRGKSLNEKAVSLHLFEDVFGWIAVLLGAVAMTIWDIPRLDSILSIGFTLFILYEVFKNLKSIIEVFLEKAPGELEFGKIREELMATEGVLGIHHVHVWSLEGNIHLATLHVIIEKGSGEGRYLAIQREIHRKLKAAGLEHSTIEIEFEIEGCHPSDFETEGYRPDSEEQHSSHSH